MIAFAFYLLKVIICSGILFLYYHLALRNKLFHQWNRFYLLAAVIISLVVPAAEITIAHLNAEEAPKTIQLLQVLQSVDGYLEEVTISTNQSMSAEEWGMLMYALISTTLLISVLLSLAKIFSIIRSHTFQWIDRIKFTSTGVKGTPFSFFHFIFWNKEIDLQTETGQQIFKHELVHVKEKHSFDKLFIQIILVLFWCNPFFWLIRRELKMIHEFIADKKAVGEYGTAALAAMILRASYPSQFYSLTNQFFQTSIKRRLAMLTKIQHPKINYVSRLLALLIVVATAAAFTLRANSNADNLKETLNTPSLELNLLETIANRISEDTIPKKAEMNILQFKGIDPQKKPLYILDGKEITEEEIKKISSESIASINVLKDHSATEKYGSKGANGVIEIHTKSLRLRSNALDFSNASNVLIVVDGKALNEAELKQIDPDAIESMTVLKGATATAIYGEKAKEGAIIITTKSAKKTDTITVREVTLGRNETEPREYSGPNPGVKITEVTMKDLSDTIPKNQNKFKQITVNGKRLNLDEITYKPISWEEAKKAKGIAIIDGEIQKSMTEVRLSESEISSVSLGLLKVESKDDRATPALILITTKKNKSLGSTQPLLNKAEIPPSMGQKQWEIPEVTLSDLKRMKGINIPNVISFTAVMIDNNGDLVRYHNKGWEFNEKVRSSFSNLKPGDLLTFESIVASENNVEVKKPSQIFKIVQ